MKMDILICGVCKENFQDLEKFINHKEASHLFSCGDCGAFFHSVKEAQEHSERLHSSEDFLKQVQREYPNKTSIGSLKIGRKPERPEKCISPNLLGFECITSLKSKSNYSEVGTEGLFHCKRCEVFFKKERQLQSHRCLIDLDISYSSQNIIESGTCTDVESQDGMDKDQTQDFNLHILLEQCPLPKGNQKSSLPDETIQELEQKNAANAQQNPGLNPETVSGTMNNSKNVAPFHLPVFNTENERQAFEDRLNSVDLSCLKTMYTSYQIQQELHQLDQTIKETRKPVIKGLIVYACNTCKKVFKSEAHMRVHCLSHTPLKPYTCLQCEFSSNSKGSLHNHMRMHTGNFFTCDQCTFQTGNRSHLREHKETHSKNPVKCKLCRHSYKTNKSLRNHVLRYHQGVSGKKYLMSLKSKNHSSMSTLHLCEVCNKKFKKKKDRDYHQAAHKKVFPHENVKVTNR